MKWTSLIARSTDRAPNRADRQHERYHLHVLLQWQFSSPLDLFVR